jgi:phosphoribosylformimino-5-aminoimidazole carboxamide ribotide isomerase
VRLYPAIDILDGSAVRLLRGDFDASTVYDADPVSAAKGWVEEGAHQLHVVDLDGAREGEPVNIDQLRRIVDATRVPVQYGGGLRTAAAVERALAAGAERVILGTAAFTDPALLDDLLATHPPERIAVGVDVRGGRVATHGWLQSSETPARDAFARLRDRGVRSFVFTNVDRDGTLDGASAEEFVWAAREAGEGTVIVSGGIGTLDDLRALASLRREQKLDALAGVIVGTALYERRFTVAEALAALSA